MAIRVRGAARVWAIVLACGSAGAAEVIYVNAAAMPGGNGRSWGGAYRGLQPALARARAGDQVWVARGEYSPDEGSMSRAATYTLPAGVAVYAGFTGTETSLSQRDFRANGTVLNGDLLHNDPNGGLSWNADNIHHIVTITGSDAASRLDGFRIVRGFAGPGAPLSEMGAAVLNQGGSAAVANCTFEENYYSAVLNTGGSPSFIDCEFPGNYNFDSGGAVRNEGCSPTIRGCEFDFCGVSFGGGGAIANLAGSSPLIEGCTFRQGYADVGGAIHCEGSSNPRIVGCTFLAPYRADSGGAVSLDASAPLIEGCTFRNGRAGQSGGAIYVTNGSSPLIRDCQFIRNRSYSAGGAIFSTFNEGGTTAVVGCTFTGNESQRLWGGAISTISGPVVAVNCTFVGNTAEDEGGALHGWGGRITAVNSLFVGNSALAGGAVYIYSDSLGTLINCTAHANAASAGAGGVHVAAFSPGQPGLVHVLNSLLWGNTGPGGVQADNLTVGPSGQATIADCSIEGWDGSLGGVNTNGLDPEFLDPLGPDLLPGTGDENLRLGATSPARDSADAAHLPPDTYDLDGDLNTTEPLPLDLDGRTRTLGRAPDRGPFEARLCYPDCDTSTGIGVLDVFDFLCFQNAFAAMDPYACDCDLNSPSLCDIFDFLCFQNAFAEGCP